MPKKTNACAGFVKVGLITGASLLGIPNYAMAQQTSSNVGVEELVVTAQRRSERLQDVPISVTAVTQSTLEQYGVGGTLDLAQAVPGFMVQQRNVNATPYLRGLGNDNGSPGDEPAVAIYVDGVYRASSSASTFSLNNIERLEVLKGPQGTLFGRNAAAGVINIITRDPKQEVSGKASVGYGNYNTFSADGYVTGGITSNLAADMSVYYKQQFDGWGKNIATGKDAYKSSSVALRSKWKLDLDNTVITAIGDWSRDHFTAGPGTLPGMLPGIKSQLDGNMYYVGLFNIDTEISPWLTSVNYGASLQINHDFDWARFVSISAYRVANSSLFADSDATPLSNFTNPVSGGFTINFATSTHDTQFTQEFQLLSPESSKISWIVGAFLLSAKQNPVSLVFTPPSVTTTRTTEIPNKSYAAFAQATAPLFEATNLTLGIRYSIDKKSRENKIVNGVVQAEAFPNAEWKKPTWRIALDHKFTPDVMAYASYNRGYKAGLYEYNANRAPISPQTIDAFEVGLKTAFLDHRLVVNTAGFYSKEKNLQISTTAPGGVTTLLLNAAAAEIKGIDLDITAVPVERLQITASGEYLSGKFTSFKNAPLFSPRITPASAAGWGLIAATGDATGRVTNNSPKWAINLGVQYTVPVSIGNVDFRVSDSYTSSYFINIDHQHKMDGRHLVNSAIALRTENDKWEFKIWAQNLFDKHYYVIQQARTSGDVGLAGAPRTFGVSVQTNF